MFKYLLINKVSSLNFNCENISSKNKRYMMIEIILRMTKNHYNSWKIAPI